MLESSLVGSSNSWRQICSLFFLPKPKFSAHARPALLSGEFLGNHLSFHTPPLHHNGKKRDIWVCFLVQLALLEHFPWSLTTAQWGEQKRHHCSQFLDQESKAEARPHGLTSGGVDPSHCLGTRLSLSFRRLTLCCWWPALSVFHMCSSTLESSYYAPIIAALLSSPPSLSKWIPWSSLSVMVLYTQ